MLNSTDGRTSLRYFPANHIVNREKEENEKMSFLVSGLYLGLFLSDYFDYEPFFLFLLPFFSFCLSIQPAHRAVQENTCD